MLAVPPTEVRENLPRPLTRFIGRADELRALGDLIRTARLVTLTGVGGSGKTRLAREVAAAALDRFPDGVRWVDLAPLADGALVPQAVAAACGVVEQPGRPILETLVEALAPRRRLLVLDNCEHLLDHCAPFARTLLERCPDLTILTTSRESLGTPGETIVPVAPLPVPPAGYLDDTAALTRSDAIALFADRARAVAPAFAVSDANVREVARVCRKLDGIPLALELAAARVRLLSVSQIAGRLDQTFQVLGGGQRAALPRQQTLRATLDWSYALLVPDEAALFRCLAVFAGDFALEAVEGVCGARDGAPVDVLDVLGRLVDKSLVVTQEDAGAVRYRLLEVVRQYAREKLEAAGEEVGIRSRHADYYAHLAQRAGIDFDANVRHQWLNVVEREHENLRAAIGWSLEHGAPEQAGEFVASLWRFWLLRGYLAEGRRWLELALARLPDGTLVRARVLQGLAILTFHHQGYAASSPLLEEALALYQALNDRPGLAIALLGVGLRAHSHGDYARAMDYFERSLPICWETGREHTVILCLNSMGFTALHLGYIPRARALCTEALMRARAADDLPDTAGALTNLGIALLLSQEYGPAEERLGESLKLRREIADAGGMAHTLRFLGRAAHEQGDPARAEAYYLESFALRDVLGEDEGLAEALEGLAAVAAARGDAATATLRLGTAETLRERVGTPLPAIDREFYDRWLARIHELLDDQAFAAAWAAGRDVTPKAARDAGPALAAPPAAPVAISIAANATPAVPPAAPSAALVAPADEPSAPSTADRPRPALTVLALGEARVYRGDEPVAASEWTYRQARELLFYLLCRDSATKEQIGLALWPDADPAQLRAQLHPVLHHLRHALGGPEWIVFERGRYQFNRTRDYAFDVEIFEGYVERAKRAQRDDSAQAIRHLERALKLYRGDFLAGERESEWLERKREELRARQREAFLLLGHLQVAAGAHARAAETYRRLLAIDPYQERAHRELMRCLTRLGERSQALRAYEDLADLLRRELGASPAPETAALAARVRQGDSV
ncbi:MAG TPA: BTAD domain-containing putative transcriptional regulator [Ktedonobacterales bacterium]